MQKKHIYLPKSKAKIILYLHEDSQIRPCILIFPGGGYTYCSGREEEPIALAYFKEGFQSVVVEYSTGIPLDWAVTSQDANNAMKIIVENHSSWNIDVNHIAVIGFSAGGHLGAYLSVAGDIRPCAAILCYPLIIESLASLLNSDLPGIDKIVDEKTPPIFVFSTFEDHIVPVRNTLRLLTSLNELNIPFECHIYEWGHHGLALANEITKSNNPKNVDERAATWFSLSVSWLKRQFETNFLHPKTNDKGAIEHILKNEETRESLQKNYPILKNREIIEAVAHMSEKEFIKKIRK